MKRNGQAVQDLSTCFNEFNCGPLDHMKQTLQPLQSGIPALDVLAADLLSRKEDGKSKVKEFLNERLYSINKSFSDLISHMS